NPAGPALPFECTYTTLLLNQSGYSFVGFNDMLDIFLDSRIFLSFNSNWSAVYNLFELVDYTCRYIYNRFGAVLTCISIGTIAIVNQSGDTFVGFNDMLDIFLDSRIFLSFNSNWSAVEKLFS